jgi:hypothetical protein
LGCRAKDRATQIFKVLEAVGCLEYEITVWSWHLPRHDRIFWNSQRGGLWIDANCLAMGGRRVRVVVDGWISCWLD